MAIPNSSSAEENGATSTGELHLIGLGLGDESDITLRGLQAVKKAGRVYLEAYTSILGVSKERLEEVYECDISLADRQFVEENAEQFLEEAQTLPGGVAFLVVGDPFGATTHSDLWLRAKSRGIHVNVVHNASIMNAVAACGLQLYNFGQTVSLCFWTETDHPSSYFDKIVSNRRAGLHTLCLLDIKVKEPTFESLARGKKLVYEPPRYMSIAQALEQLVTISKERESDEVTDDTVAIGVARLGQRNQDIACGSIRQLREHDFGEPLHSLVIPAPELHFHEEEVMKFFEIPQKASS